MKTSYFLGFSCLLAPSYSFVPAVSKGLAARSSSLRATEEKFQLTIDLPPTGSDLQATMQIESILSVPSDIVEVRYKVPFELNIEPKNSLAVCTKDGKGGEKEGDILRYTSAWSLGLPEGDGLVTTAAAFSGGLSWKCTMFNVLKAKAWEQVVGALTSNEQVRRSRPMRGENVAMPEVILLNNTLLPLSYCSHAPMRSC